MTLPANVGHGTVRGRFIDSNGTSITGKVTFAPTPKRLLNATAEPTPVTILPKPVTVDLDGGEFVTTLIATDDPDNNPQGWNYRVSFNFQGAQADPFNIEVPEGETVDLTTVAPVSASGGTPIIRGPAGEGVPDYEGVEDGKVLVLVDGEPAWGDAPGGGGGGPVAWDDVEDKPSTFPPEAHTHEISDVTGLQSALDGKAAASHTHGAEDIPGLSDALAGLAGGIAGKVALRNNNDVMVSSTDTLGTFTVESDGTATSGWPNRLAWLYKPLGGVAKLVQWINEYGELRITPARSNTVGFRVFAGDTPTDYESRDATVPVMEVSSDRTNRNNLFGVYSDGALTINGRRVTVGPTPPGSPSTGDLHILTES